MNEKCFEWLDTQVNIDDIPTDYCWSGDVKAREEFERQNFYVWNESEKKNILCSDKNAIALADYILNYLIKSDVISDVEEICGSACDQWFSLAWEERATRFDDFPKWIQWVFVTLAESEIIQILRHEGVMYYSILDVETIIEKGLSAESYAKIEKACKKSVNEFWENQYNIEGEVIKSECDKWRIKLYEESICSHETVEIGAYCSSDNGPSIEFGITIPIKDLPRLGDRWIYEGIAGCIYENRGELVETVKATKEECFNYYAESGIVPESENEIRNKARAILEKKFGKYDIYFKTDKDIQLNDKFFQVEVNDAIYSCMLDTFAIAYSVWRELKSKSAVQSGIYFYK